MPSLLKSDGSRRVWHRWGTKIFKTFGTKLQTLDPVRTANKLELCKFGFSQHHDDIQGTLLLMGQVQLQAQGFIMIFRSNNKLTCCPTRTICAMCNVLMVFRRVAQVQEKLRLDLRRKIEALDIDQTCFSLDNRSEPLCDHFLLLILRLMYLIVNASVSVFSQYNKSAKDLDKIFA